MSFHAIITADVKGFSAGVDKAGQAIENLAKKAREKLADIGKSFGNVGQAIENLAKKAREKLESIGKSFENVTAIGKSFENAGKKASILSAALIAAGGASFKMAADFQDAIGATDQIYKDSSKAVKDWADSLPSMYGVAKSEALEYANLMGSMLTNIGGLTEKQAAKQSASLIKLAGDLSAMFGGSTESAVKALTGALKGNNAMLDNYGMAVTDSLVKARAFELGLAAQGEELSLNAKQAATLSLIYEQTGAAQGQAAREADGASGSMRALGAEIKNLSIEIGGALLPIITPIITKLKEWTAAFREMSPETRKTIIVIAGIVAAVGPVLIITGKMIKAFQTAKVAMLAFNVVAAANPYILIAAALVAVAVAISKIGDAAEKAKKQYADFVKKTTETSIGVKGISDDELVKKYKEYEKAAERIEARVAKGGMIDPKLEYGLKQQALRYRENMALLREEAALRDANRLAEKNAAKEAEALLAKQAESIQSIKAEIAKLQAVQEVASLSEIGGINDQIAKLKEKLKLYQEMSNISIAKDPVPEKMERKGLGTEAFVLDATVLPSVNSEPYKESLEEIAAVTLDLGGIISNGVASFAASIGEAFADGNFEGLGAGLLGVMADMVGQLGQMLITAGIGMLNLAALITNPFTAIAAGVAMVALAAAAGASVKKTISKTTGGGGSMGGTNSYNQTSRLGDSSYRGAYKDDWNNEVVFKIGNNELVGTLDKANNRRERL